MPLPFNSCMELCARAHAGRSWPKIGFSDKSANSLAQLLGINLAQRMPPLDECRLIERCKWFDECCSDFFQRHPHALCIELGAGLSTRFHRLSNTLDWPRFRWVDVDLPGITASKAEVMPTIDNYSLMGADIMHDDWLGLSGWTEEQPLLIVIEGIANLSDDLLMQLIYHVRQQASGAQELEIIFDMDRPKQWKTKLQNIAAAIGLRFTSPITNYISALRHLNFHSVVQTSLLEQTTFGLVINYKK